MFNARDSDTHVHTIPICKCWNYTGFVLYLSSIITNVMGEFGNAAGYYSILYGNFCCELLWVQFSSIHFQQKVVLLPRYYIQHILISSSSRRRGSPPPTTSHHITRTTASHLLMEYHIPHSSLTTTDASLCVRLFVC